VVATILALVATSSQLGLPPVVFSDEILALHAQIDALEAFKPAKDKSTERIDGIVAAIMAIGRAMVAPSPRTPCFFA
jgi:hypothetical protein